MKIFRKLVPILIQLSLLCSPVLLLQSCGDEAPYGSSITLVETVPVVTYATYKEQKFRVSVADSDGNPMNGISVQILGGFAGTNYGFNNLPTPGITSFTIETNDSGYNTFSIVGPLNVTRLLSAPTNLTLSTSTSTVTTNLPSGTYCYQVTAIGSGGAGETSPTAEECTTLTVTPPDTGTVTLAWTAPSGAANGYYVYGNTLGGESRMTTVLTATYTDDAGDTPDGTNFPPCSTCNTTLPSSLPNSFSDTLTGISGAVIGTLSIQW